MTRKKNNANNKTYGQAIKFKVYRFKDRISCVRCTKQNDKKKADVNNKHKQPRKCFPTTRMCL